MARRAKAVSEVTRKPPLFGLKVEGPWAAAIPIIVGLVAGFAWFGFQLNWTDSFLHFLQFTAVVMTMGSLAFIALNPDRGKQKNYDKLEWNQLPDTPVTRALLLLVVFAIVWIFTALSEPPLDTIIAGKIQHRLFLLLGIYVAGIGFSSILTEGLRKLVPENVINDRRIQRLLTGLVIVLLVLAAGIVS